MRDGLTQKTNSSGRAYARLSEPESADPDSSWEQQEGFRRTFASADCIKYEGNTPFRIELFGQRQIDNIERYSISRATRRIV